MRLLRPFIVSALLLLSACGGSKETTPPPTGPGNVPPAQPGPPASLTMVSGDAQSAPRLTPLTQPLSVLVKDAAGTALSGIAVQFTVDSGGGSLSTSSATTGPNGVAVGGVWTLGNTVGANEVSARVGSLTPLRFRAMATGPEIQTVFTSQVMPATGGTITYTKSGDPLNGLSITVPSGAYATSVQWTVTADSTAHATLPADVVQVGPMLTISNDQGYADSAMTLKMPLAIPDSLALVPFYYDSATQTFEGIPLVERTETSVTLATYHFSRDFLAIPANVSETSALRSSMRLPFGEVKMVWAVTPKSRLNGTFSSNFRAAVDNWEFVNYGDYISPGGMCLGMSVTAMYYHFFHRAVGEPGLYGHYDKSIPDQLDNVQGIRFAGAVQADYVDRARRGIDQRAILDAQGLARGTRVDNLSSSWILLTLKVTSRPVMLAVYGPEGAHALIAYSATSSGSHTTVSFVDPNLPTAGRVMAFESGVMTATNLATRADRPPQVYTKTYAMSVSSFIPITKISSRFREFLAKNVGADRYPRGYKMEYLDYLNNAWTPVTGLITTSDELLSVRHICTACPIHSNSPVNGEQPLNIWKADGTGPEIPGFSNNLTNKNGRTTYYGRLTAFTPDDPSEDGFLDAIPFEVLYKPFTVAFPAGTYYVGDDVTYTAEGGPLETAGSRFRWLPDDGTAAVTAGKTYTYRLKKPGRMFMEVKLQDATGKFIARAVIGVFVNVRVAMSLSDSTVAPGTAVQLFATANPPIASELLDRIEYRWRVTGTPAVNCGASRPPTTVCIFPNQGSYQIYVDVYLDNDRIESSPEVTLEVEPRNPAWRLTSFRVDRLLTPGAIVPSNPAQFPDNAGIRNSDHVTWYKADSALIARLTTAPATGVLVHVTSPETVGGVTYRPGLYLQSDPTGTPGKPAAFDATKVLFPIARTPGAPFPDVYTASQLPEPYADVFSSTTTALSGSSIVQLRDFTGLPAVLVGAQRKRTLLAWQVNATKNGAQLSGTMARTQPMWVYFVQGMYYYNLFTYEMSFTASRAP